ncbi:MAG: YjjG family noncanonical pyrimidine nucleotidase [Bacteroidota bacterium]
MLYRHLFFDLDHTLWDFESNSRNTLEHLYEELSLAQRGVDDFYKFHRQYLGHNEKLWERYRKGFIKQDELRVKRMWLTLLDFRIADEDLAKTLSVRFLELLPTRNQLFPNTLEILRYLQEKEYQLHIITNGFEEVQHHKLKAAALTPFFQQIITSEKAGALKPHRAIYEHALDASGAVIEESLMIGDSMDVDIKGAWEMGMDQIHVNHLDTIKHPIQGNTYPTHTIFELAELKTIL